MELVDYLQMRWKAFLALFVIGLVVIAVLALRSGQGDYTATARLLVRPSTASGSSSDADRVIEGDLAQLFSSASLKQFVQGTNARSDQLSRALHFEHSDGSDLVTLTVDSPNADTAVTLVNNVADGYLADSKQRALAPILAQQAQIRKQSVAAHKQITGASAEIAAGIAAFEAANPDRGIPSSSLFPGPAATLQLAQQNIQQLNQQLVDLSIEASPLQDNTSGSRVVRAASSAQAPTGWGPVELLAALVGLALLLLALAGAGLAVSKRILGVARWEAAAKGMAMAHPVRIRSGRAKRRALALRRVRTGLGTIGDLSALTHVVYLPALTPKLERRTDWLLTELAAADLKLDEGDDLMTAVARGDVGPTMDDASAAQTMLIVDVRNADFDDVLALGDLPAAQQRVMIPVLV